MAILERIQASDHEQLLFTHDRDTGLRAIIAVHNTTRGPGLGGIRIREYDSEADAVDDVLRLSQAMSYKNACAGLDFGGAKAVILAPLPADRRAAFLAMGRIVEGLAGRYVATEDMGMTEADIAVLNEVTAFAVGRSRDAGGSGDPSPHTALGVFVGMRATARTAGLGDDMRGLSVAVQGCGKVGLGLIARLIDAGACVIAADTDAAGVAAARDLGADIVATDQILAVEADVLAPCAVGGVLNEATIPTLRCRAVAGGANNQLATEADADRLAARGIVYAPDFVINAGGVINVGDELAPGGYSPERVRDRVLAIEQTLAQILAESRQSRQSTAGIAVIRAQRLLGNG